MSIAHVPPLIALHNLPSELITLITMSFNAKRCDDQRLSSSLAISATESFISAFPDLGTDIRAVARKVRLAGDIAERIASQVDDEVGVVLAAVFFLRRANKSSVWQFTPWTQMQAIMDLRRFFGVSFPEARELVQYGV